MSELGQPGQAWVSEALARYEGPLIRYALRLTGDAGRAHDVVQETFLKLCHEDAAQLDGHVAQWLYTVCRHQALDIRRKESRMTALAEPTLLDRGSPDPGPEQIAEDRDSLVRIRECLEELAAAQQECIRLKFEHGLSYRQIAGITGLSLSNVGYHIHAGISRIRERLRRPS
jgi:RNA polymerase sigma-70 factor (ECF subfamily)